MIRATKDWTTDELREIYENEYVGNRQIVNQMCDTIDLLQWRIEAALKASTINSVEEAIERMELILRGDYDNKRDEALEVQE